MKNTNSGETTQLPLGPDQPKSPVGVPPISDVIANAQPASEGPAVASHEFFLAASGFVYLTTAEVSVVNHPALQRLDFIKQLGQTFYVYRSAHHTRFAHTLGAIGMAERIVNAINANHQLRQQKEPNDTGLSKPISEKERSFIRLAALLHDVGHLSCGHTLEDELLLLDKHDGVHRLERILNLGPDFFEGFDGLTLSEQVDSAYKGKLDQPKLKPSEVAVSLIAKRPSKEHDKDDKLAYAAESNEYLDRVERLISKETDFRLEVCRDIVANTVCADLLDYLHRDWYHIGKPKYFDDRLLQYMQVRRPTEGDFRDREAFVIYVGKSPKIKTDAVSAILDLLESRYSLAESVLFHRTKCAAAAMLERAIAELSENGWKPKSDTLVDELLLRSDSEALSFFLQRASENDAFDALRILHGLRYRKLYKELFTFDFSDFKGHQQDSVIEGFSKSKNAPALRLKTLRMIETDFELPTGCLAMYCPGKSMNAKIAKVKIAVGDHAKTLSDWESRDGSTLTGGHLSAQLVRFHRLWRVHIFCEAKELQRIKADKRYASLKRAFREIVFNCQAEAQDLLESAAKEIAEIVYPSVSPEQAARLRTDDSYPTGIPAIRSFKAK